MVLAELLATFLLRFALAVWLRRSFGSRRQVGCTILLVLAHLLAALHLWFAHSRWLHPPSGSLCVIGCTARMVLADMRGCAVVLVLTIALAAFSFWFSRASWLRRSFGSRKPGGYLAPGIRLPSRCMACRIASSIVTAVAMITGPRLLRSCGSGNCFTGKIRHSRRSAERREDPAWQQNPLARSIRMVAGSWSVIAGWKRSCNGGTATPRQYTSPRGTSRPPVA